MCSSSPERWSCESNVGRKFPMGGVPVELQCEMKITAGKILFNPDDSISPFFLLFSNLPDYPVEELKGKWVVCLR